MSLIQQQKSVKKLLKKYSSLIIQDFTKFQEISKTFINQLASKNNNANPQSHQFSSAKDNKQVTSNKIIALIQIINDTQNQIKDENQQQSFLLAFNALRSILIFNFNTVSISNSYNFAQNQMCNLITMIYAKKLSQSRQFIKKNISNLQEREQEQQDYEIILREKIKLICQSFIMNQIMFKILQKSKQLVPQYFSWLLKSFQFIKKVHSQCQQKQKNYLQQQSNEQVSSLKSILTLLNQLTVQQQIKIKKTINMIGKLLLKQLINFISIFKKDLFIKSLSIQNIRDFIKSEILQNLELKLKAQVQNLINQNFDPQSYQKKMSESSSKNNQQIYIQEPQYFRELTPRIITQQSSMKIKLLKKKKAKMQKKLIGEMKTSLREKVLQDKILNDVRRQKIARQQKKQMFVMQKQTQEAKKHHNAMKKLKKIRKDKK